MSRILILGVGPLPIQETQEFQASSSRVWHIAEPLILEGHDVRIVCMNLAGKNGSQEEPVAKNASRTSAGFTYIIADEVQQYQDDAFLRGIVQDFAPDGLIGVNAQHANRACQIGGGCPVWADMNGYHMGEAQLFSEGWGVDWGVESYWYKVFDALRRADVFSVASDLQKHVLIGELGATGRLNRHTVGYEFAYAIPNGRHPDCVPPGRKILRGGVLDDESFIVYWSGGYNLWCDVDTLYRALEIAMSQDPSLHFVSTGGEIAGVDRLTYSRFQGLIRQSSHASRYHLLGWVPSSDLPCYYAEADIGINVDRHCYESIYGARNRITDMLKYSLPVISTLGTEISHVLETDGCGLTCAIGDAEGLAFRILEASARREMLRVMGERARQSFLERYTSEGTTRKLAEWARNPWHAPDFDKPNPLYPFHPPSRWARYARRLGFK